MKVRLFLAFGTLIGAALLVIEALGDTLPGRLSDLFLNLGTEMLGIFVTVLIIDWLLERRRSAEEAKRIAQSALNELDHHVWVWQGGAREFDLAELLALLSEVSDQDPLPSFTQNLFLMLGSRAADTLRIRREEISINPHLKTGLELLSGLEAMRDGDNHLPPKRVAVVLLEATRALAIGAGVPVPPPAALAPERFRQSSMEQQEWRHYGTR